jgi:tetratricopeptide (TPR) repeat protein
MKSVFKKTAGAFALFIIYISAPVFLIFIDLSSGGGPAFAAKKKSKSAASKSVPAKKSEAASYPGVEIIADDVFIYKKGISYYENSDYDKACEYFKYIKEKRPASFYYDISIYLCGESYKKSGKECLAAENYLYLLEKCPASTLCAEARHTLADIYKRKGLSGDAIKYYKQLLEFHPQSFWAEEARAFLKYNSVSREAAQPDYSPRKSAVIHEEIKPVSRRPADGIKTAEAGAALDTINSADSIDFNSLGLDTYISGRREYEPVDYGGADLSLYRDGLKFHEIKNYGKAKWCYQRLIIKYKNSLWYPNSFYMLGACYLAEGDTKAAIRFYSAALIYAKDAGLIIEVKNNLADLLFSDGQYLLALRYYESLIETARDKERMMQLFFLIGECHTKTGNYEMAAKSYARVALEGALPRAPLHGKVQAAGAKNDKDEGAADDKVKFVKTISPQLKINIGEGVNEFNAGKYLKSISFFERVLVENPDEAICFWYLALSYNQLEKNDRAIGYLQKYISLISTDKSEQNLKTLKQAYSTLAYIYIKENRFEEARTQYLSIISLDSTSASALSAREALKRIDVIKKRAGEKNE